MTGERHAHPVDDPQTRSTHARRVRLLEACLYLVCDAVPSDVVEGALRGGVDIVQLRMKGAAREEILREGRRIRALCAEHAALFIVNDRPELAVALDADGVHLGQDDLAVPRAREIVGPGRLIGLSTHTRAQLDAGVCCGADYLGVGPVHATPTKPGRPAVGLDLVRYAAGHAPLPFFAIGGIDPVNVAAVRLAGARRVAVVRAITQAADPEAAAACLRAGIRAEAEVGAAQP